MCYEGFMTAGYDSKTFPSRTRIAALQICGHSAQTASPPQRHLLLAAGAGGSKTVYDKLPAHSSAASIFARFVNNNFRRACTVHKKLAMAEEACETTPGARGAAIIVICDK